MAQYLRVFRVTPQDREDHAEAYYYADSSSGSLLDREYKTEAYY